MADDARTAGMQRLANAMIDAGCESVVGIMRSGHVVIAAGDDLDPPQLADMLITIASKLRVVTEADITGRANVTVDDDDPLWKMDPPWKKP